MNLLAVSDLHVGFAENQRYVRTLRPETADDWLLVAGDVAERVADVEWTLRLLRERFSTVVWVPGNHELWTLPGDSVQLRGAERYRHLVQMCRTLGVLTPEDPFPVWDGPGGPVTVAPLFVLYDHTFRSDDAASAAEALEKAYEAGVVATDEALLHPDPYDSLAAWCAARITESERRLATVAPDLPTVLVNHFPLIREPTRILRHREFALWCGSAHTGDWHRRYRADTVVYGHLHIPRTIWRDGVRFEEVSVGYPREWQLRGATPGGPTRILPRR